MKVVLVLLAALLSYSSAFGSPLEIVQRVQSGKLRGGHCVEYAISLRDALESQGVHASLGVAARGGKNYGGMGACVCRVRF